MIPRFKIGDYVVKRNTTEPIMTVVSFEHGLYYCELDENEVGPIKEGDLEPAIIPLESTITRVAGKDYIRKRNSH